MATRYAVATGNWSATATWDGGTLPASTDDVYANNFTVTIDQNITVGTLRRSSNGSPAIAAGGSFVISVTRTLTITNGVLGTYIAQTSGGLISVTGSGAVTISGGLLEGGFLNPTHVIQLESTFTGTLTVNNTVKGGGSNGAGVNCLATGICTVIFNGTVTGLASFYAPSGVKIPRVIFNGPVTQTETGAPVLSLANGAQLTFLGPVTSAAFDADTVTAQGGANTVVRVGGPVTIGYRFPFALGAGARFLFMQNQATLAFQAPSDANWPAITGAPLTLGVTSAGDVPAANVRQGVVYGAGGLLTGSLKVPPPDSVASGVPTDNTVGTAALKLADVAAVVGAQIEAAALC